MAPVGAGPTDSKATRLAVVGMPAMRRVAVTQRHGETQAERRRGAKNTTLHVSREPRRAQRTSLVVHALVHARLFRRFEILTLDAQVFVTHPFQAEEAESVIEAARPEKSAVLVPTTVENTGRKVSTFTQTNHRGLAHAVHLLDEGAKTLERSRKVSTHAE
jgi:hypothetical protein